MLIFCSAKLIYHFCISDNNSFGGKHKLNQSKKTIYIDWSYISGASLSKKKGKVVNQVSIGDRLEAGEFKFVFILGTNPAVTLPNQSAVRHGLDREDVFVVVQDTHWSETTALLILKKRTSIFLIIISIVVYRIRPSSH
jgi:anaerobic selenocysteine-containing dehydrogenase